jgi:hypothetical protein
MPRRRRKTIAQRWFKARHTCSAVTCGFFPPEPLRLSSHKTQHHQRQYQMPYQPRVIPTLIIHQPRLLLAQTKSLFYRKSPEGHRQQQRQGYARRIAQKKYLTSAVASLMATINNCCRPATHTNTAVARHTESPTVA